MKPFISLHVAAIVTAVACLRSGKAQDGTSNLLARLSGGPFDQSVLYSLEALPPDVRIMPALRSAFESRKATAEKQWIAATLVRLGEKSDAYFNYLAAMAKNAVEDRAPFFIKYDNAGNSIRGEYDIGFLNWCAQNGKDPREIAKIQFGTYVTDVRALAYSEDRRADELLRMGLDSPNTLVVAYSVEGLGRLHDAAAIPLIERSIDRTRIGDRLAIAEQLCWFGLPDAERLFERFVPDAAMREASRRQIQMLQISEQNRILRRNVKPPQ